MKVLIVHLSDMHIKNRDNLCLSRKEQICRAFQNVALGVDRIFVVITGDVAYSGSKEEYSNAALLLEHIKDTIEKYANKEVKFIMVPGNHDCQCEIEKKEIREILIKDVQKNQPAHVKAGIIDQCCEVQREFKNFAQSYHDHVVYSDNLLCVIKDDVNGHSIVFYCYNTAWLSELDEQRGKLHFPVGSLPTECYDLAANLYISVLHHPFAWLNEQNARELSDHLDYTSHLVLTGHSHISSKSVKDNLEGNLTEYVEGRILQGAADDESGFNMIELDLDEKLQRLYQYKWNGEIYSLTGDARELSLEELVRRHKDMSQLDRLFQKNFLNDVGAQFRHPKKPVLVLKDIFVFPNMRDIKSEKRPDGYVSYDVKRSDIMLETGATANKILLIGAQRSGKTALCKVLYSNYYKKGYTPVYINGDRVKSASIDRFNKLLSNCYLEQYKDDNSERFDQRENSRKFIIIDDYDESRMNLKTRSILLDKINQYYPNVVITANDLYKIGEIVAEEEQEISSLKGYQQYALLQFGHELRDDLIERWNTIDIEEVLEDGELMRRNDEAKRIINVIIGRNLVPSYPLFLLTILQGIEIGYPHNLEDSSYGPYYQFLTGEAISGVVDRHDKVNAYHNYLTELAYFLFDGKTRAFSLEKLAEFHRWYCENFAISPSFAELFDLSLVTENLIKARILEEHSGIYKFKYKYVYFFFVAKYLSDNIHRADIKEIISEMCKRLYVEDFADTIMFLTHHSRNPFVLDEILTSAKHLFAGSQPIKLEQDICEVNNLLAEIPKLVLERRDVKRYRKEIARHKDEVAITEEQEPAEEEEINLDVKQQIKRLDTIGELNLAFKMLEVLGQILKNYHSSLDGRIKLNIGEEVYMLGLRSLEPFFKIMETHKNYLLKQIENVIARKKLTDELRIEEAARRLLFTTCCIVSFGFIEKIAESVGTQHLSETFKEILDRYDVNSIHLVDMSIKLNFFPGFPFKDVATLKKRLEGNILALTVLREMAVQYVYMFPTDDRDKQRICSILEIPMRDQLLIDMTSTQKKT
jgi:3',5'-cyclic AMP phosphodiesterase CpdA/GTPase SAR1 family protein